MKRVFLWTAIACLATHAAHAEAEITHDAVNRRVTMADGNGNLRLRVAYDGRCMLDRVVVRGRDVVSESTGVCSAIRVGSAEYTTRAGLETPKLEIADNRVTLSAIRFGGGGIEVEETWAFTIESDCIAWRIARKYVTGGTLDDTSLPGWNFTSNSTWTGALLGTGGVAWFKLFDTPTATYGVHTGPVTFWNRESRDCLRMTPTVSAGQRIAARFSRQPQGTLSFNYSVAEQDFATRHDLRRFSREERDIWAPFQVRSSEVALEMALKLEALDYDQAYDRGEFRSVDGAAVREICNTIARLGVIDTAIMGSNGWYSGYAVLQEQWLAQLGLPIDDPAYIQNYTATLDHQREHAIDGDGRVKSRWYHTRGDDMPGTYDVHGFYECQWGYMLDSQPDWVINVAEQFDFTGDMDWLRRQQTACRRVLEYLLCRDSNQDGLVEVMTNSHAEQKGCDWLDVVWASFEVASINAQMYHALLLWADCEERLDDREHAAQYRAAAAKLKASFNKTTAEGGFWNPDRQWYVHWRNRDGAVHGDNLVLPVNFMAIAYGLCDDPPRRDAILGQTETAMQREKLFFWPACIYPYEKDEGLERVNWPFPAYENGDIFLAWGEVATRAYAPHDPAIALRYVKNVLRQYDKDGLAFQRYLRKTQSGAGDDILANMANPIVGLYRNIYGIQPKWNRLYLEPHLTPELNGTRLKYWLRGRLYVIDLSTEGSRISLDDWTVGGKTPFAVHVQENGPKGDVVEYFPGRSSQCALSVARAIRGPLELSIEAWTDNAAEPRCWTMASPPAGIQTVQTVSGLTPGAAYQLQRNDEPKVLLRANGSGQIEFDCTGVGHLRQRLELTPQPTP